MGYFCVVTRFMAILTGFLLTLASCTKVSDLNGPVIVFTSPVENASFILPDTIEVSAEILDDEALRVVTLMLVDQNGVPRAKHFTYYPTGKEFNFSAQIPVTDPNIPGGFYYLVISADDGQNPRNKYLGVYLSEVVPVLLGYVAVTGEFDFKSRVIAMDDAFETDTTFEIPQSLHLSAVSGSGKLFFFAGPSAIMAYEIPGFEPAWTYSGLPPFPWFSDLFVDRQLVFSTGNGDAGILDEQGRVVVRTEVFSDARIRHLAADDTFIYSFVVSIDGAVKELALFYRGTGILLLRERTDADIVALLPDDEKALILANYENFGVISEIDPEILEETWLKNLPGKKFVAGLTLGNGRFLLLTTDGVMIYERYYGMLSIFAEGPYHFGRFDPANDWVYLVKDRSVDVCDRQSGIILQTLDFEEQLKDFQVVIGVKETKQAKAR